jgi:hypothetical protein
MSLADGSRTKKAGHLNLEEKRGARSTLFCSGRRALEQPRWPIPFPFSQSQQLRRIRLVSNLPCLFHLLFSLILAVTVLPGSDRTIARGFELAIFSGLVVDPATSLPRCVAWLACSGVTL